MKKTISYLLLTLFTSTFLHAQQQVDNAMGWYADGVKVESLSCYGFKTLQIVVKYKSEWEMYDKLQISVRKELPHRGYPSQGVKIIPVSAIKSFLQGDYLVYSVIWDGFAGGAGNVDLEVAFGNYSTDPMQKPYLDQGSLKYNQVGLLNAKKAGTPAMDDNLSFTIEGISQTGIEEKYDNSCSCIKKLPIYKSKELIAWQTLKLTNRQFAKDVTADATRQEQCTYEGKKLENILSGTTTETKPTPTTAKPVASNTTTSANTTTPATGSSVLKAATLKPLDKTKPGYTSNKNSNGIVTFEAYKKNGGFIGEARTYTDEGKLVLISTYVNDELNGYSASYDEETGDIIESGNYKAGEKDGEWKRYKNGKVVGSDTYVNGEKQ